MFNIIDTLALVAMPFLYMLLQIIFSGTLEITEYALEWSFFGSMGMGNSCFTPPWACSWGFRMRRVSLMQFSDSVTLS